MFVVRCQLLGLIDRYNRQRATDNGLNEDEMLLTKKFFGAKNKLS